MTEGSSQRFIAHFSSPKTQEPLHVLQSFTLDLDLIYPQEFRPDREALLDHLLRNPGPSEIPPFALLSSTQEILVSEDPTIVHENIHYRLEPQLPGHQPLTFLEISFLSNDPATHDVEILSPLAFVDILPAIPNAIDLNATIAPLSTLSTKEPIELATELRGEILKEHSTSNVKLYESKAIPWLPIGVLLLFLLITFLIRQVLNRKKSIPSVPPALRQVTALNEAEQSLAQLKQDPSPNREVVRTFMTQLTWSLRYYFESEFKLKTSSQTTQEFLETLKEHPTLGPNQKASLLNFLQIADRIKFANYQPDLKECLEAHSTVQQIEQNL